MIKPFTTVYDGNQQNINYTHQLMEISNRVHEGNLLMQNYKNYVDARLAEATRKKKRSCLKHVLTLSNSGEICMEKLFDDNSREIELFILNIRGNWQIHQLKFDKTELSETKFSIRFLTESTEIYIIGDKKRNTKEGLYSYFVRAGIIFNEAISERTVKQVIFETFAPKIDNCLDTITMPGLAGWFNNMFVYRENFYFTPCQDFPDLPIFHKHFLVLHDIKKVEKYIQSINGITQWKNRINMLLIPVLGILSSLLEEQKIEKICFDVISLNRRNARFLSHLLQVFNRDILEFLDMGDSDRDLRKKLLQFNDEVILVDILCDDETAYQKKKKVGNVKKLVQKLCFNESMAFNVQRSINAVLVVLSNSGLTCPNMVNIFTDDNFFCNREEIEATIKEKCVEAFFSEFVKFVEENIKKLKGKIFQMYQQEKNKKTLCMDIAWEILKDFCISVGINLELMLSLPRKIDFSEFLQDELETDDLKDAFVKLIREEIKKWRIAQKLEKISPNDVPNSCFYDEEYIYIPSKILDRMLGRNGYLPRKFEILSALREEKFLKVNAEGLTCRLQVCGLRFETYRFYRNLFEKEGAVDIIYLGRGDE